MPKFPYRLRYVWDGKQCGYYGCAYCVLTGMYLYVTRTYRTRKEAREDVECAIVSRKLIGVH